MEHTIGPPGGRLVTSNELARLESDLSKAVIPQRPGLLTEKSHCCNAPVITVGRGLHGDICQQCGKPHEPPRFR